MDAPAGWYPDPLGRFEHRYWDGARWTEHASRGGTTYADPLDGPLSQASGAADADVGVSPDWSAAEAWDRPSGSAGVEGLAIVSLILSVVWLFGLGSIAGIITGVIARRRIQRSDGERTGAGIALAGIIVGILTLGLTLLVGLFIAVFAVSDVTITQTAAGLS